MEFAELINVPMAKDVAIVLGDGSKFTGSICITGHHLIFNKDDGEQIWLLHKNVDCVQRRPSGRLSLCCKDFLTMHLDLSKQEDVSAIADSIDKLSNLYEIGLSYPFYYHANFEILENGWDQFKTELEFSMLKHVMDNFRITYINKDFEVCPSYPPLNIVPKNVTDESIMKVATFRRHRRFPVLSYSHKKNSVVMLRSSEPLTGPMAKRCKEDQMMIDAVLGIGTRGYVLDTRSMNHAKVAQAKGGGFETDAHYPQWRRIVQPVEQFNLLHDSLVRLIEAVSDINCSVDKYLSRLESSGWLCHIKDILTCACVAAQCIDTEENPVLVHGGDGFDSTLQICSLAQIILDGGCRTITGFQALLEREWIQAGHPFSSRNIKSCFATSALNTEAPVFLLFLDCVWQIWCQFSSSFEFNETFLIFLVQHSFASEFGTFIYDNERERSQAKVKDKTVSIWSYINRPEQLPKFMNPLYEPNSSVIWPSVAPQTLVVWEGLYMRHHAHRKSADELLREAIAVKLRHSELHSQASKLRRQLGALEKEAVQAAVVPAFSSMLLRRNFASP